MIEVNYQGRLGNNLFQYCTGRILAEKLNYVLRAPPITGFPGTRDRVGEHRYREPIRIDEPFRRPKESFARIKGVIASKPKNKIILNGFFQLYSPFSSYKDQIRNDWLRFDPPSISPHEDDMVVHVRRGDTVDMNATLPVRFYEDIWNKANTLRPIKRTYIVTEQKDAFTVNLAEIWDATVMHQSPYKDLQTLTRFNRIIMSVSTFSWWGAWLSHANEIFYPLQGPWMASSMQLISGELLPKKEDRYIYVMYDSRGRGRYVKSYLV